MKSKVEYHLHCNECLRHYRFYSHNKPTTCICGSKNFNLVIGEYSLLTTYS